MSDDFIFTSESVTRGHPDKLCDQVSDAIVDEFLSQDPYSGVAGECAISGSVMFIAVRYASEAKLDIPEIARRTLGDVGYPKEVLDADACTIITNFVDLTAAGHASTEPDLRDDADLQRAAAKNNVTLFGYACDQTASLMPLPIALAHRLAEVLDSKAVLERFPQLLPDGQSQVGIEYRNGEPSRVHSITLTTTQSGAGPADAAALNDDLARHVIEPVFAEASLRPDGDTLVLVNPDGRAMGGGPSAHSGLTGRKTGVDTYGEYARHSGAALSGKDPMRIDRVGAYAARYAAKNVVAAGLARECEVTLSYSIGFSEPVSVRVRTFGTGTEDDASLTGRVREVFDFRLGGIVDNLRLHKIPAQAGGSFYRKLAAYGQMGRTDMEVPWESTDKAGALK